MVTCTDCVHYKACKMWVEHVDGLVDDFNSLIKTAYNKGIEHFNFPLVAETKGKLCDNYDKAKLK